MKRQILGLVLVGTLFSSSVYAGSMMPGPMAAGPQVSDKYNQFVGIAMTQLGYSQAEAQKIATLALQMEHKANREALDELMDKVVELGSDIQSKNLSAADQQAKINQLRAVTRDVDRLSRGDNENLETTAGEKAMEEGLDQSTGGAMAGLLAGATGAGAVALGKAMYDAGGIRAAFTPGAEIDPDAWKDMTATEKAAAGWKRWKRPAAYAGAATGVGIGAGLTAATQTAAGQRAMRWVGAKTRQAWGGVKRLAGVGTYALRRMRNWVMANPGRAALLIGSAVSATAAGYMFRKEAKYAKDLPGAKLSVRGMERNVPKLFGTGESSIVKLAEKAGYKDYDVTDWNSEEFGVAKRAEIMEMTKASELVKGFAENKKGYVYIIWNKGVDKGSDEAKAIDTAATNYNKAFGKLADAIDLMIHAADEANQYQTRFPSLAPRIQKLRDNNPKFEKTILMAFEHGLLGGTVEQVRKELPAPATMWPKRKLQQFGVMGY